MPDPPKTLRDLQQTHRPAPPRRREMLKAEDEEHSAVRNYVRDIILGFNDGLVSVYAIVAGVVGAALGTREIAIAGMAAAVAGALSMGLGEYISTKSQTDYYRAEAQREREHIREFPKLERQEVREMLAEKGYPTDLIEPITTHVTSDEDRFVEFMMREEFGVGEESERSPWVAMGLVMAAFVVGAILPLAPFLFPVERLTGFFIASGLSVAGLFAAGAIRGATSGLHPWARGAEMVVIGAIAAGVTFVVGTLFGVAIG